MISLADQNVDFVLLERREKPWELEKLVGRIDIPLTLEQMPMYFRTETESKYHNLFDASLFSEKGCTEAHLLTSLDRFLKNLFGTLQVKLLEILARLKESSDSQ